MTIMCLQCCGERKTAELANARAGAGAQLAPLRVVAEAYTYVPTPQGVVPVCYEHIVVQVNTPLVGGNGSPISRLLN